MNRRIKYLIIIEVILVLGLVAVNYASRFQYSEAGQIQAWFPVFYKQIHLIANHSLSIAIILIFIAITLPISYLTISKRQKNQEGKFRLTREYLMSVAFFFGLLFLAEIGLRIYGYNPGFVNTNVHFKPVKDLKIHEGFYADTTGIFKVTPEAVEEVNNTIELYLDENNIRDYRKLKAGYIKNPYRLIKLFLDLHFSDVGNQLDQRLEKLKTKEIADMTLQEQALWTYLHRPLNHEGFKSIPFEPLDSTTKTVLLLGDSFTWGYSAKPVTNSFADILLASGYGVYNTGIAGLDPTYYEGLAKKWIPILKPDIVIVNLFLGNDIQYYHKELRPSLLPPYFVTNAGNLYTCNEGIYFDTPEKAFELNLAMASVWGKETSFGKWSSKTVVGSLTLETMKNLNIGNLSPPQLMIDFNVEAGKLRTETPNANQKCSNIKKLTEHHGGRFILAIIPDLKNNRLTKVTDYPNLLTQIEYFEPETITPEDYSKRELHFNNKGHQEYAAFLISLIEAE